jgi:multicomponent K+:H+ antiporter subunit D
LCAVQTIQAGPVLRFMNATAESLYRSDDYIRGVLGPAAMPPNRQR